MFLFSVLFKTFKLKSILPEQKGWYSCIVTNEQGHTHSSGFVNVLPSLPLDPNSEAEQSTRKATIGFTSVAVIVSIFFLAILFCCGIK